MGTNRDITSEDLSLSLLKYFCLQMRMTSSVDRTNNLGGKRSLILLHFQAFQYLMNQTRSWWYL
uniref:Uncharacterized protein n=1 Tax=Octopus bimaculoides TaxID=37653 RepID=A0A0L8FML2_OCTBM